MAKPKSPLLSLGARGTIGDALTYQKRGREHIVREKPIPTDPYSLAQAYQRWDYRDYAYLWTLLTDSQKQVYRTAASRYHITGFSLWMREQLKTLPDLAGRWHLDKIIGGQVLDSSKNTNHGTVFGASLTDGIIDRALAFDGIDNRVAIPHHASLDFTTGDFSIEAFIQIDVLDAFHAIFSKGAWKTDGYQLYIHGGNRLVLELNQAAAHTSIYSPVNSLTSGVPYHLLGTREGNVGKVYIAGVERNSGVVADCLTNTRNPFIGAKTPLIGYPLDGIADEVRVYKRALDATEAKRHSERSYP